jgi:hypothetical protein
MNDLTAKFTTLETQLGEQHTATQEDLNAIRADVAALESGLFAIQFAVEAGNRQLLAALSGINPCNDCEGQVIAVPPIVGITSPIDEDKCKRVQAFLHTMEQFFTVLDTASAFSIPFNLSLVNTAVEQVIAGLDSGDTPPAISFPEATMLVGDLIVFVANNILDGRTLSADFSASLDALTSTLYLTGAVEATKAAYAATLFGAGLPAWSSTVLVDTAYNDLFAYYFDPASSPNLTGYDGDICLGGLPDLPTCTEFQATEQDIGGTLYYIVSLPPAYGPFPAAIAGDYFGWTFQITGDEGAKMGVYYWDMDGEIQLAFEQAIVDSPDAEELTFHTQAIIIQSDDGGDRFPFGVIICPPLE